jgi:hypothetical protein
MKPPRRLTAIVAQLLMLQLILLGSGIACMMPGMGGQGAAAIPMARMDMTGQGSASMPNTPAAPSGSQRQHAPCRFPWAPAGCHGMLPCAPAAVASADIALIPVPFVGHEMIHLVVLAPPSRTTPPELPPPRT